MEKKEKSSKKKEMKDSPVSKPHVSYRLINCTQSILAVPYFNDQGKQAYLNVRIQKRRASVPPVISQTAVTPGMRAMQKRKLIRLELVK